MSLRIAYGKLKQCFNLHTLPQARVYIGSEFSADGDLKPAFRARIKPQACVHACLYSEKPPSVGGTGSGWFDYPIVMRGLEYQLNIPYQNIGVTERNSFTTIIIAADLYTEYIGMHSLNDSFLLVEAVAPLICSY